MENNKEKVNALQNLLQKNYDAEAGYKQVMVKAENQPLKNWLLKKAAQRNHFATELDSELRKLNVEPKESGTLAGDVHRVWIDVKTALSKNDDEALLEECIRGEKASVDEYESQLKKIPVSDNSFTLITNQMEMVKSALVTVKRLEDIID